MALTRLDIVNFRNLLQVKLDSIAPEINFFYGQNGSGKTSLLEALYYLSRGRSFRCSLSGRIIHHEADKFSLFAHLTAASDQTVPMGVERQRNGTIKIRAAGQNNAVITELVYLLPALLLNSNGYELLEGGPLFRRKFLDWGGFYTNENFLRIWKQFERALKQRNAILRARGSDKELESWTRELLQWALLLDQSRRALLLDLQPLLNNSVEELLSLAGLKIQYFPGWDESYSYEEILRRAMMKDRESGFTQYGPHRADIKLSMDVAPVKDILSRGQQKLFVCAMIVAQGALLQKCVNRKPIYLVDDLPSELDKGSQSRLMALLLRQKAQVFLTAVEKDAFAEICQAPLKMFHVEQGNIKDVTVC